jgi:hypothetical protein
MTIGPCVSRLADGKEHDDDWNDWNDWDDDRHDGHWHDGH